MRSSCGKRTTTSLFTQPFTKSLRLHTPLTVGTRHGKSQCRRQLAATFDAAQARTDGADTAADILYWCSVDGYSRRVLWSPTHPGIDITASQVCWLKRHWFDWALAESGVSKACVVAFSLHSARCAEPGVIGGGLRTKLAGKPEGIQELTG